MIQNISSYDVDGLRHLRRYLPADVARVFLRRTMGRALAFPVGLSRAIPKLQILRSETYFP